MKLRAPMQLGMDGPTLAEVDNGPYAGLRGYVPDIEMAVRALDDLRKREERMFRPTGARVYGASVHRLERLILLINRGRGV